MTSVDGIVFVVDDDGSVRNALTGLIRSVGLQVEAFTSAQEFLARPRAEGPACLVLDVRLPGMSGLELQQDLAQTERQIPIVFLTGYGDIPMSVRAIKAGAVEFLTKPFRDQELVDAIQAALARDRVARKQRAEIAELRGRSDALTSRERDVFRRVVRGLLNKQIAAELGITETTIKQHRAQVMRKMRAGSLADLVRMAEKLSIAPTKCESSHTKV